MVQGFVDFEFYLILFCLFYFILFYFIFIFCLFSIFFIFLFHFLLSTLKKHENKTSCGPLRISRPLFLTFKRNGYCGKGEKAQSLFW